MDYYQVEMDGAAPNLWIVTGGAEIIASGLDRAKAKLICEALNMREAARGTGELYIDRVEILPDQVGHSVILSNGRVLGGLVSIGQESGGCDMTCQYITLMPERAAVMEAHPSPVIGEPMREAVHIALNK